MDFGRFATGFLVVMGVGEFVLLCLWREGVCGAGDGLIGMIISREWKRRSESLDKVYDMVGYRMKRDEEYMSGIRGKQCFKVGSL